MTSRTGTYFLRRACLLLPFLSTIFLVIFAALPIHMPFYAAAAPALSLAAIYYWTLRRADLIPYSATFAAGLLQDVLLGTPLGVFTLTFLVTRAVVFDGRGAVQGRPFWALWLGFGLVSVSALLIAWTLVTLLSGASGDWTVMALTLVTPFVVFPVVFWPLIKLDGLIVELE